MYVGVLRLWLRVPGARSLKEKRKTVRSLRDRIQSKLRCSVAEVGDLESHQRAVLGVSVVSVDGRRVDELLAVAASMAGGQRDALLVDRATEILSFGTEGGTERFRDELDPLVSGEVFGRAEATAVGGDE
ncbi:MAG: DUF503 domain-containing protein [Myxococcota bacterium]